MSSIEDLKFGQTHKYILIVSEQCKNDYVVFQAAQTIKEAVVREWTLLQPADVESLRTFLLHYVTRNVK